MSYSKTNDRLFNELKLIGGTDIRGVYFQTPESVKMVYPCIRYKFEGNASANFVAANRLYGEWARYTVVYMSTNPNDDVPNRITRRINQDGTDSKLQYCKLARTQCVDGLHHWFYNVYEIVQ